MGLCDNISRESKVILWIVAQSKIQESEKLLVRLMGLKRVGRVGLGFKMEEKREYELDPHMRSLGSPICGHAGHSWVGIRVWLFFPINRFIFASSSFSDFPWCRISTPIVEPWWRSPSARLPNLSLFLLCHFDSVILL